MFNLLAMRKNFTNILKEDVKIYTRPHFRLMNDLNTNFNSSFPINNLSISEMYFEDDLLIFLSENGSICFFDTLSKEKGVRVFNKFAMSNKIAKSIALDKLRQILFVVYLNKEASVPELKCCSIQFNHIKEYLKQDHKEILILTELFTSENLSSPAFVEFDENNQKIITRNSLGTYKIWKMENLNLIFELSDRRIEEIRTGTGIILTIRSTDILEKLKLNIYDIENGKLIINYEISLFPELQLEILEIFDNTLIMKQGTKPAIIINLLNFQFWGIQDEILNEKSLFLYISKSKIFITLNENSLSFYSLKGELLRKIQNEKMLNINPNHIHLSSDKNFLIIFWEERKSKRPTNIKNITTKKKAQTIMRTPASKIKSGGKIDFTLSASDSEVCINLPFVYNSTMKMINSNISKISQISFSSISGNNYDLDLEEMTDNLNYNNEIEMDFFSGEFELISLKEDYLNTILNITADSSKLIMSNENLKSDFKNEKFSYFTFDSNTMRLFGITSAGKLIECSI